MSALAAILVVNVEVCAVLKARRVCAACLDATGATGRSAREPSCGTGAAVDPVAGDLTRRAWTDTGSCADALAAALDVAQLGADLASDERAGDRAEAFGYGDADERGEGAASRTVNEIAYLITNSATCIGLVCLYAG